MTQSDKVRAHLESIGPLDRDEAQSLYGVRRLAPVIEALRKSGLNIVTGRRRVDGATIAAYELRAPEEPDMPLFGGFL